MARTEHPHVSRDPLTPVVFLERTLRVFPNRPAVVHGDLRCPELAPPLDGVLGGRQSRIQGS